MPAIEFVVFDRAAGTLLTALPNAEGRGWQEVLNETGTGKVTVGLADSDLAHLDEGNIVRCYIDAAAAFAWVVGPLDETAVSADEEAGQERTVNGRGTLSVFDEAVVYPEGTSGFADFAPLADRKPADSRRFDFSSPIFDDSGWVFSVPVPQPASLAGATPAGMPDSLAEWIWNAGPDGSNNNPTGDVYFRHHIALAAPTTVTFFMTCDDGFEFYVDGQLVLADLRTPFLQLVTRSVTLPLVQGRHVLAVRGVNGPGLGSDNPGAFILAGFELGADGDPATAVVWTDPDFWLCEGYPADPPGVTPGEIIRILVEEAQARGALPGVTLGFDDDEDSAGTPWPVAPDVVLRVGTDYLQVLSQLTEVYCDVAMDPGSLRLDAWVERGSASGVTLAVGASILGLTHRGGEHQKVTAVLGRYGDHWLEDTAGSGRRRESYMELGSASSSAQADRIVDAAMASKIDPVIATTVAFEPIAGVVPNTNFKVGDTVSAPTPTSLGTALRVLSLSVSETETDYDYAVEVGSLDRDREERVQMQLRKSGPAGLQWTDSPNAQPAAAAGLGPDRAAVLPPASTARIALNDLVDVATVPNAPPADGDVLTWDDSRGVSGMWTPTGGSVLLPTGAVAGFITDAARSGWLYLDGSTFLEADYPDLFAALGGGTLPNWRNHFLVGAGDLYAGLSTGGSADAIVVEHDHPGFDHTHSIDANTTLAEASGIGLTVQTAFADRVLVSGTVGDIATGSEGASYTTGAAGSSGSGANLPPFAAVFWFIKT